MGAPFGGSVHRSFFEANSKLATRKKQSSWTILVSSTVTARATLADQTDVVS